MRWRAGIVVVWLALLGGCASSELEARLVQLEARLTGLERRLDAVAGLPARMTGIEAALATPPAATTTDLEARLAALEAQLAHLERPPAAAGPPPAAPDGPTTIPGGAAPPAPGARVDVLSAGSGDLLLVRTPAGLVRVALLGIEAPLRAEVYPERLDLRDRHVRAFGNPVLTGDEPFERARARLEELVRDGQVSLSYGGDAGVAATGGAVRAYVSVTRDGAPVDVNAAMVREGLALARGERHDRAAEYKALEAEARAEARGLFGGR